MTKLALPRAEQPEELGLSSVRLDRITATIAGDVESGALTGPLRRRRR